MLFLISTTSSATLALLCFTAALTCKAFGQAGFVANQQEIAPFEAGKLAGISNTFGSLAGALGTRVAGTLLARTGTWESVFYLMASLYCVGNALWLMLCRVDPPEHPDN
jgi:nitrate/nitrite transporter NarK